MRESHLERIEEPWFRESVLTKKLFCDTSPNGKARFHKFDLWHNFHLGVGKHWIGGGLLLLQGKIHGNNIEERFSILSRAYREFCKRKKIPHIISKVDQHLCGITMPEPAGTWNKAAVTSNLCLFVEDYLLANPDLIQGDERLCYFETCLIIQAFLYV